MTGVLNGLLGQAIKWRPDLAAYLDEQRKQGGEQPSISRETTSKKLTKLVSHGAGRTYMVIDGIDECPPNDRTSILSFLSNLVRDVDAETPGMLRLLVISQNEPDIRKALSGPIELQIKKDLNAEDIRTFVSRNTQPLADFRLTPDEIELLQQKICLYAAGIVLIPFTEDFLTLVGQFLYAKLVLEHLCASNTLGELRQELQSSYFPKELSEA